MTFCSQARRTCGTTDFIRLCTILHATGFGLPPNFEDCIILKFVVLSIALARTSTILPVVREITRIKKLKKINK